ncbi:MAG: tannase/feruloyl esterase family alpha/beta hydrolase [Cellvibrionaceae bacterium]
MTLTIRRENKTLFPLLSILLSTLIPLSNSYAENLDCNHLKSIPLTNAKVTFTGVVPKEGDLPEHCEVSGVIYPSVRFEIRLPTENWNNKFYMTGCGGFCGRLLSDSKGFANAMNYGLRRSYAVSTMDSGHQGDNSVDGRWALNNRQGEIDWGYRAVHETANITKTLIKAFYENGPDKSYFSGCSTGGRMANMAAYRYPNDFDGVISGAPALNYTNLVAVYFPWMLQANTDEDGNQIIHSDDVDFVADAVIETCDELDGIKDNIIEDPESCNFQAASLQCSASNTDSENCLTSKQVNALNKLYEGPTGARGNKLTASKLPLGSETSWPIWVTGPYQEKEPSKFWIPLWGGKKSAIEHFSSNFLKYMAYEQDPRHPINPLEVDLEAHQPKLAYMGEIYNSDKTDLTAFKKRGGKMLMWHGWADSAIPAYSSINYYDRLAKANGGVNKTQDFARLFLMPGTDHCGLFPAHGYKDNGFDALTALENWVEKDQAPDELMLTKFDKGGDVEWKRPTCSYPMKSLYNGEGDPNSADSFSCVDSATYTAANSRNRVNKKGERELYAQHEN